MSCGVCETSASEAKNHGQEAGLLAEVDIAWEMPANRHAACLLQTQLSDKSPQAVNKATHKSWAKEYGVICLGGTSTFFTIDGADEPQFWPPDELRTALTPSGASLGATCLCASSDLRAADSFATWHVRAIEALVEVCRTRGNLVPMARQGTGLTPALYLAFF